MCRNIKPLFNYEPPASRDEIRASAVQFVRKVSGFTHPSKANEVAFEHAIDEVEAAVKRLMGALETNAPPRDRAAEIARKKEQARIRYGREPALAP